MSVIDEEAVKAYFSHRIDRRAMEALIRKRIRVTKTQGWLQDRAEAFIGFWLDEVFESAGEAESDLSAIFKGLYYDNLLDEQDILVSTARMAIRGERVPTMKARLHNELYLFDSDDWNVLDIHQLQEDINGIYDLSSPEMFFNQIEELMR
jgi:hypothetical protein